MDVQLRDGKGQNHQAYLWQYGSPGGGAVFDFQLGRAREGPKRFLGNFEGILQTDGYAAFEQVGGPKMVHAVCWAHARRKFIDALKLNPADKAASRAWSRAWTSSLPSSALAKAAKYTPAFWKKLARFLEYPELELSNNLAENSMRPIALGRKNWIHVGSEKAGPRVAAILSVVESCRRLKISARDYLAAVLPGLADTSIQWLADLTPAAWAARAR